ncbi:unnamed protein product [Arctia plantaginis]|uniref:THAP-type domain-containing protein n=1 Tax=Arctia plantaginis TaxID=874455 RepID=A0A8S1BSI6_ARCPL|nr:unnamed protein product [Arctia plantaginis]
MPLTSAQKQKRYREKLQRENPEKYAQMKKKIAEGALRYYRKKTGEYTELDKEERRQKWRDERKNLKQAQHVKVRNNSNNDKTAKTEPMHVELRKENLVIKRHIVILRKRFETLRKNYYRQSKKLDQLNKAYDEIKEKYQEIITRLKEQDSKESIINISKMPRRRTLTGRKERLINRYVMNDVRKRQKRARVAEFPSDPFRCAEWVSIVAKERGEEMYNPYKNSTICSIHFDRLDITGNTQRRRLLNKAIPKLQIHGPIKVQTAKSSESTKDLSIQATSSATLSFNDSTGIRDVPRADAIGLKSPDASFSELTSVCDTPRKGPVKEETSCGSVTEDQHEDSEMEDDAEIGTLKLEFHEDGYQIDAVGTRNMLEISPTLCQESSGHLILPGTHDEVKLEPDIVNYQGIPSPIQLRLHGVMKTEYKTEPADDECPPTLGHHTLETESSLAVLIKPQPLLYPVKTEPWTEDQNAIQMEVVADVYQQQQQTQQETQQNIQSTQTRPYSNAERQRRYREKRKADKMNACTTFSQSSDVQPQQEQPQHEVQNNKRQPQSSAERQRKYRKLLREQQPHRSSIQQLQNVDPAEHARKRHLNKQRQSRFRARQRFQSPGTSSHQAQAESVERIPVERRWTHYLDASRLMKTSAYTEFIKNT